jgi:hypothetical protein
MFRRVLIEEVNEISVTTTLALWYGAKLYYDMRPVPVSTLVKIIYQDGAIYFVCIASEWCLIYALFTGFHG